MHRRLFSRMEMGWAGLATWYDSYGFRMCFDSGVVGAKAMDAIGRNRFDVKIIVWFW